MKKTLYPSDISRLSQNYVFVLQFHIVLTSNSSNLDQALSKYYHSMKKSVSCIHVKRSKS